MPLPLSQRAAAMPASPIRRLAPYAVEARKRGLTVHGLNIGQPDIPTPQVILDRIRSFDLPYVAYGPSQGLPEFQEALRQYYASVGVTVSVEPLSPMGVGPGKRFVNQVTVDLPSGPRAWVMFHAKGSGELEPVHPGRRPFAASNPILFQ